MRPFTRARRSDAPTTPKRPITPTTPAARVRRIGGLALTVVMAIALTIFVAMTVLRISGGELLAVRTGSMRPSIEPGDLIVTRGVDPRTVKKGDVITFRVPSEDNTLVTHRVVKVADNGNKFTTKGDANDTVDPFETTAKDVLGTEWFSVPKVGQFMVFLASGLGTALLIIVPGCIYLGQTIADRRAARRAAAAPVDVTETDALPEDAPADDAGPVATPATPAASTPPPYRPSPPAGPPAAPFPASAAFPPGAALPPQAPPPYHPSPIHLPAAPVTVAPHPAAPPVHVVVVQVPSCHHQVATPAPPSTPAPRPAPPAMPLPAAGTPPLAVPVDQLPAEVSERLGSDWALLFPIEASVAATLRSPAGP